MLRVVVFWSNLDVVNWSVTNVSYMIIHLKSQYRKFPMMSMKLIPAAVLLAVMGVAQAEVSVYGLLDVSYGKNFDDSAAGKDARLHSGGDGAEGNKNDNSSQGNSTTKVGLKGGMDVGAGLKANFQLETAGITREFRVGAENGSPFFNRQAWAGLSGGFGEVRFGKQDSVVFQTMVGFDFNGAANAVAAQGASGAATWGAGRQSGSLQYISPVVNGFKAQIGYVAKDADLVQNNKSSTSLGLTYAAGKFSVAVAGESKRFETGDDFSSVAGSYDFGIVKAMVGYANGGVNAKGSTVGLVAPVAGYNIGLNYSKNTDTSTAATELFVNREVFKNTYGYLDLGYKDANGNKNNAYAAGVIYTF